MYSLLRPLLFAADPETVHHLTLGLLSHASGSRAALRALSSGMQVEDKRLESEVFGIRFPNPIGLAAGMDKDGLALPAWQAIGFGFSEAGSVTALPQTGNPKPRLRRLPKDRAIINRMGFNNRGAALLASRLRTLRAADALHTPVLVNVGKSRAASLEEAAADYRESLRLVWPHADGVVINVSSPNTPGLRSLQEPAALVKLLAIFDELQADRQLPVLLKLSPDLEDDDLERLVELTRQHSVAGLVAVNTTLSRSGLQRDPQEEGGLSGGPLAARALEVLRLLAKGTDLPIVSVGGIFEASDVITRLRAGASLVELYTGFVYGGPATVKRMLQGLLRHLDREGLPNVAALIGVDR